MERVIEQIKTDYLYIKTDTDLAMNSKCNSWVSRNIDMLLGYNRALLAIATTDNTELGSKILNISKDINAYIESLLTWYRNNL